MDEKSIFEFVNGLSENELSSMFTSRYNIWLNSFSGQSIKSMGTVWEAVKKISTDSYKRTLFLKYLHMILDSPEEEKVEVGDYYYTLSKITFGTNVFVRNSDELIFNLDAVSIVRAAIMVDLECKNATGS